MGSDVAHREYSAALPAAVAGDAATHLLQHFRRDELQEDICLALWRPSLGRSRYSALIESLVLPTAGERGLQGNVILQSDFLERGVSLAREASCGLAIMHSHPSDGWQGMSKDDINTERGRAGFVQSMTGHPLLGLTIGTDEAWSARFWKKVAAKTFEQQWCHSVRVVGPALKATHHPRLVPDHKFSDMLRRPVSVWGDRAQQMLSKLHVGVVGLGSVGSMVSEGLARMGVGRVSLIDFDRVQPHNLDRLLGATTEDAAKGALKVSVAAKEFKRASTVGSPNVGELVASVVEPDGYKAALDCDVLFSCVDRHWPRRVLNHIAYAHLIPVVDGGIRARFQSGAFRGVEWSLRTSGPGRRCLKCAGGYDPTLIELERSGKADDPAYIAGLPKNHELRSAENVFSFSMCLAGHELLQFVALVTALKNKPDLGDQRYYYNLAEMRSEVHVCQEGCSFPGLVASGDSQYGEDMILGRDPSMQARDNLNAETSAGGEVAPKRCL